MDANTRIRVDNFLAHYSSDNYDPVKAHEYYLKNRELSGRQSTKGMSEVQKEAWSYTKDKIGNDKKAALEAETAAFKARMDELRNKATETRDRIKAKLEAFLASIEVKRPTRIEAKHIEEPELLPIPDGISLKRKAYLQRQNSLRMQKYGREVDAAEKVASAANKKQMDEYTVAREAASESSKKAREDSKGERERVGGELKAAVANARTAYADAKKQLIAKFEATKNTEYDNIRSQLPSAPPKAAKGAGGSKKDAKAKEVKEEKPKPGSKSSSSNSSSRPAAQPQASAPSRSNGTGGRQQILEQ